MARKGVAKTAMTAPKRIGFPFALALLLASLMSGLPGVLSPSPQRAAAAPLGNWERIADGGFGAGGSAAAAAPLAEYGGALYCGVASEAGARVMRWDGAVWSAASDPGFGSADNVALTAMSSFGGFLYAGTLNQEGCEVWRYDGAAWGKVVGTGAGAGNPGPGFDHAGNLAVLSMREHLGRLYMGTGNLRYSVFPINVWSEGAEVWSTDGTAWVKEAGGGFGDSRNAAVTVLQEYGGSLYAGTARVDISTSVGTVITVTVEGAGCELRRKASGGWEKVGESGLGRESNAAFTAAQEYGGELFLGTANGGCSAVVDYDFATGEIIIEELDWHSDGCCVYRFDGAQAEEEVSGGFGDTGNVAVTSAAVAVVDGSPGGQVLAMGLVRVQGTWSAGMTVGAPLKAFNGLQWYRAAEDGFGDDGNSAVSSMLAFSGAVCAGTANTETGCQVWRGEPPPEPVPAIAGMEPGKAGVGTVVVLRGTDFGREQGSSRVVFSPGVEADVLAWSDQEITCRVPVGAESGEVVVTRGSTRSEGFVFQLADMRTWFLAEGCTGGDFETFVLVQNPGTAEVTVDLILQTSSGEQRPALLQDQAIPAGSRRTFRLNDHWTDWNVSCKVEATGDVICERAMYGGGRTWAHDSVGIDP